MKREEALELVKEHTKNQNLVRHMLAVEAVMGELHTRIRGKEKESDKSKWKLAGLLHDADYETVKDSLHEHTHKTLEWLEKYEIDEEVKAAILAHGWNYVPGAPEPKTEMEWALYCCDELTGLIVAVALVKPDKKLASVTVDSVMNKWKQKSFAAGASREQIGLCESRLQIPVKEFVEIALRGMQSIAGELGL
jgi:hypothetical protein